MALKLIELKNLDNVKYLLFEKSKNGVAVHFFDLFFNNQNTVLLQNETVKEIINELNDSIS